MSGHVDPSREAFARFRTIGRAGPIHMLNLLRFRERAAYDDGTRMSGAQAYAVYAGESAPVLHRVGGSQIWVGRPEQTLIGPAEEVWDLAFIAAYPSAEAFVAMLKDPAYRQAVRHRQAAVADSRLVRLAPGSPGQSFGSFAPE